MNLYSYYEELKEIDNLEDSRSRIWDKIEELEIESGNWFRINIEIFMKGSTQKLSYVIQKNDLSDEDLEEHVRDYVENWLHSNWIFPQYYRVEYDKE